MGPNISPSRVRLEGLSNSSSPSLPVWSARCAPGSKREVCVECLSLMQSLWPELRSFVGGGNVEPGAMPGSDWQNPLFVHEGRAKRPELSSRVRAVVGVLGVPGAWGLPVILITILHVCPK